MYFRSVRLSLCDCLLHAVVNEIAVTLSDNALSIAIVALVLLILFERYGICGMSSFASSRENVVIACARSD